MLEIKIKPAYAKTMGEQYLGGQSGTVNGIIIKIGFGPGKKFYEGPIIQFFFRLFPLMPVPDCMF